MNVAHPFVRVYLVEDSPILTKLLVGLIEADSGALVVGQADNARAALADIRSLNPDLVVLDLRQEEVIFAGNRFMIYALFPDANISIHVLWGVKQQNTVFATGKSILNRTSKTNIGELMLQYGGGGHENAGTCQVANDQAADVLGKLIKKINGDG
jgi:hypothetical protein